MLPRTQHLLSFHATPPRSQGRWPSGAVSATIMELTAAAGREFAPVEAEVRAAAKARPRTRAPPRLYVDHAVYI